MPRGSCRFALVEVTKLHCVKMLCEGGWSYGHDELQPFRQGTAQTFDFNLALPKAYYIALLQHAVIQAKGNIAISHGMPSKYYECLLTLDGPRLQQMIADMTGQASEFFAKCLTDAGAVFDASSEEDVDAGPVLAIDDGVADANALAASAIEGSQWIRC